MHKTVLVLGSTCVDVILRVHHLPKTEEDMHPLSQAFRIGGCAYNVAHLLGLAGAPVTFVTPVGMTGFFGPYIHRFLLQEPWAHPVCLETEENGCCYCLVEDGGERTFLSLHGIEYTFRSSDLTGIPDTDYTYVCGLEVEEKTGDALVHALESRSTTVFYAPGPRVLQIPEDRTRRLLALRPILHLNAREAQAMSGKADVSSAMDALFARTGQPVIVTLGTEGAAARTADGLFRMPAEKNVTVRDTIGAGDVHAGGMLYALSRGLPMEDALRLSNCLSAAVIQVEGGALPPEKVSAVLSAFHP